MRLALLLLLLALPACDGGPSTGSCTGRVGALALDDAAIDHASSQFHLIRKRTCAETSRAIFDFSYGDGALVIRGETPGANIAGIIAWTEATYPLPPTSASTRVRAWDLSRPASAPAFSSGAVRLKRNPPRVAGDFSMAFADGSSVQCDFDLYQGASEGERIDCGGDGDDD